MFPPSPFFLSFLVSVFRAGDFPEMPSDRWLSNPSYEWGSKRLGSWVDFPTQWSERDQPFLLGDPQMLDLVGLFPWNFGFLREESNHLLLQVGKGLQRSHKSAGWQPWASWTVKGVSRQHLDFLPSVISDILQFRTLWSNFSASTGEEQSLSCTGEDIWPGSLMVH